MTTLEKWPEQRRRHKREQWELIQAALRETGGKVNAAARLIGIDRGLMQRIKKAWQTE